MDKDSLYLRRHSPMFMRWPFVLLSSFLGLWHASGQMTVLTGTSLTIVEGTSLRIDTPLNWVLESGSATINNGTVELGPGTELLEAFQRSLCLGERRLSFL